MTAVVIPAEVLEAKRREREERRVRWPPEGPMLGEDLEAEIASLNERRQ